MADHVQDILEIIEQRLKQNTASYFSSKKQTNNPPPKKPGLFGIYKELQLGVCNHGEPSASTYVTR